MTPISRNYGVHKEIMVLMVIELHYRYVYMYHCLLLLSSIIVNLIPTPANIFVAVSLILLATCLYRANLSGFHGGPDNRA